MEPARSPKNDNIVQTFTSSNAPKKKPTASIKIIYKHILNTKVRKHRKKKLSTVNEQKRKQRSKTTA